MKVKFIDYHTLASNLVLFTFAIGIVMVFVRGLDEVADLIISAIILSVRYFSVILIRRRFEFGKYLLIILIARNVYRLVNIKLLTNIDKFTFYVVIIQLILVIAAFILISKKPQELLNNLMKKK